VVKRPIRQHGDANMTTRVLVRDIMNSPVISASPHDTIKDIATKMKEERIGSIIIMENEKAVGIVTDWDIVSNAVIKDIKPTMVKALDIMQKLHTNDSCYFYRSGSQIQTTIL
jgi:predicted transcriptional regulator